MAATGICGLALQVLVKTRRSPTAEASNRRIPGLLERVLIQSRAEPRERLKAQARHIRAADIAKAAQYTRAESRGCSLAPNAVPDRGRGVALYGVEDMITRSERLISAVCGWTMPHESRIVARKGPIAMARDV